MEQGQLHFSSSDPLHAVQAAVAWLLAVGCGAGLVAAVSARVGRDLWAPLVGGGPRGARRWRRVDALVVACLGAGVLAWWLLALPTPDDHRLYKGDLAGHADEYIHVLLYLRDHPPWALLTDPIRYGDISRLYLALLMGAQVLGQGLAAWLPGDPLGALSAAVPFGGRSYWPAVGVFTGGAGAALGYVMARGWGGRPAASAVAAGLCAAGAPLLFHATCLSDHLVAAVLLAAGLHVQMRRLAEGRLLTTGGLFEGLAAVGAAFYTHYSSLYLVAPLGLARLLAGGSWRRRITHGALLVGGSAALHLPERYRMAQIWEEMESLHIFGEYPDEPVAVMSLDNLLDNLSLEAHLAYLEPLGGWAFVLPVVVGVAVLLAGRAAAPGSDGGPHPRAPLAPLAPPLLVLAALGATVALGGLHIHPGTRWLLPLVLWAPVPLALGLEQLAALPGSWRHPGRAVAIALCLAAAVEVAASAAALRRDWFSHRTTLADRLARGLPRLSREALPEALRRWGAGAGLGSGPINVITSMPWPLEGSGPSDGPGAAARAGEPSSSGPAGAAGDGAAPAGWRYYNQPIVSWSRAFRERPTVYLAAPGDFAWSTAFRRAYYFQMRGALSLEPALVVDGVGWIVFTVTPPGQRPRPIPVPSGGVSVAPKTAGSAAQDAGARTDGGPPAEDPAPRR